MGATRINLLSLSTPFVHHHCLMNDWPKKGRLLLCLVLMLNDPPIRRGGRKIFIMSFVRDWPLKSMLNSDPLPPKLGRICQMGSNLKPPSPCWVNNFFKTYKISNFSKNGLNLVWALAHESMSTLTHGIQPEKPVLVVFWFLYCNRIFNLCQKKRRPTRECHRGFRIPSKWFNFTEGKVSWPNHGFSESNHKCKPYDGLLVSYNAPVKL